MSHHPQVFSGKARRFPALAGLALVVFAFSSAPVSAGARSSGHATSRGELSDAQEGVGAATCTGKTGQPGTYRLSMTFDGNVRTYNLHVPTQYQSSTPMPLVINFHGWGGTGEQQNQDTGMSLKADASGFIAIHPDGIDNSWNAGSCCGTAAALKIDDVGFARALVKSAADSYCVDATRIFATGFSNGGYMSHRLACEAADLFAAVAPASGLIGVDCAPSRPVPVIQSQGTTDLLVPYKNSKASNEWWVANNKCSASTLVYRKGPASCTLYSGCTNEASVEWCEVRGMPHDWPTGAALNATDTFWQFFVDHPMR